MRNTINFNDNWLFSKDNIHFHPVTLPHTWNNVDGMDGKGEYYRGECFYAKEFVTPPLTQNTTVYLEILAASLSSRVFLNDVEIGSHECGFSSYTVNLTPHLSKSGVNHLVIRVDNSERSHIYPQMADFTFYGGLYRGVNLILLPDTHFDVSFHGAKGLAVTSEVLKNGTEAILHLNSWITNPSEDYTMRYTVTDSDGKCVAEAFRPSSAPKTDILLSRPHLWQGVEDPYLYHLTATLIYRNETVDEVCDRFGIRTFSVDPEKGFFLNGTPMMLRGVSRHQDFLYKGNALTPEDHKKDAALIAELGANTVRLAHYQHSRTFYDLCDEYGFVVWAEIPYISSQSNDPAAHENCREQMLDLIYQNYNHPSICFWGISNEITIGGEKPGLVENHRDLNTLIKEADPSRLTTIAHVSMLPMDSALHGITDAESYNHYFGWYGGTYDKNEEWLDEFHRRYPHICLGLSEYGAEGIITYQPDEPKCRDYSEAYQAEYHEHMAKILLDRPYLWSTHVWNMFDFGCAARNEGGTAGRNNKGLVTMDRKIKKDAFYLYKAYWSRDSFVHLCGKRYALRAQDTTVIKVYSNRPMVTLSVNGISYGPMSGDRVFVFENIPLQKGFNYITATALDCTDTMTLERVERKPDIYTLPQEDGEEDGVANWFELAPSFTEHAPMEYSDTHYSVCDTLQILMDNDEAYEILAGFLSSVSGMKLNKSMLGMMREKTLLDMTGMLGSMGNSENIPENALQIVNDALYGVPKAQ